MLAEAAGPDQRAAKKNEAWALYKKIHPGSPEATFLATDTSFAQSHPILLKKYLHVGENGISCFLPCILLLYILLLYIE